MDRSEALSKFNEHAVDVLAVSLDQLKTRAVLERMRARTERRERLRGAVRPRR